MNNEELKLEISDVLYKRAKEILQQKNNINPFETLHDCYKADEAGINLNEFEKNEVLKNVMIRLFLDFLNKE